MKRLLKWTWHKLLGMKKMGIVKKMALGYILLVFLPMVLFGSILFNQFYMNIMDDYSQGKQSLVNQAANSLKVSLAQVEQIYSLFQYNPQVVDYLNGQYQTEADQVYNFLKYIRPVFSFAYLGNKSIDSIRLYKTKRSVLPVIGEIEDMDAIQSQRELMNKLKVNQGVWIPLVSAGSDKVPSLSYYQKVYNNQYSKELAVLEVTMDQQIIDNFLKAVNANKKNTEVLIVHNGKVVYKNPGFKFNDRQVDSVLGMIGKEKNNQYVYWHKEKLLVNSLDLNNLQLKFYFFSPTDEVFEDFLNQSMVLGIVILGLLVVFSVIYYVTASALTKRILNLAKHMRKVGKNNFTLFKGDVDHDEIGFLTLSYNSMIQRIDDLLNKVHRIELMKKEADYLVMQAQIKPHFLYNTLESIRMLAEINDDQEVVEAIYTYGKLLRYSLSSGSNETSLKDEVENIKSYLKVHKIRMGDRLKYEFNIEADIETIRCPRFILQPLIENSIHHGIGKTRKKGYIKVHIYAVQSFLHIIISDNGAGMDQNRLQLIQGVLNNEIDIKNFQTENSGLGLYNVSERIKVYFGEESRFEIWSQLGEGTSYILKLKVNGGHQDVKPDDCG